MFNPVIYFWINDRFRKAFLTVVAVKCPWLGGIFGRDGSHGWGGSLTNSGGGTARRGTRLDSLMDKRSTTMSSL